MTRPAWYSGLRKAVRRSRLGHLLRARNRRRADDRARTGDTTATSARLTPATTQWDVPTDPGSAGTSDSTVDVRVFGIGASKVTFSSSTYFVPHYAKHRPVARHVLSHALHEPELHAFVATIMSERPGSMVHAGVFFGDMLPSFAAKCTGTVYAFEPVAESYLLAREAVEVNDLDNVLLLHAGLGERPQIARVETSDGTRHWGGGSRIVQDDREQIRTQQVPILCIDQFDSDDISLIQLDVEGHELPALQGAQNTIARCRPAIVVEDLRKECDRLLVDLDYACVGKAGRRNRLFMPA